MRVRGKGKEKGEGKANALLTPTILFLLPSFLFIPPIIYGILWDFCSTRLCSHTHKEAIVIRIYFHFWLQGYFQCQDQDDFGELLFSQIAAPSGCGRSATWLSKAEFIDGFEQLLDQGKCNEFIPPLPSPPLLGNISVIQWTG